MSTILGIDLGTSSVKLLLRHSDGRVEKARAPYDEISIGGWWRALASAARTLDLSGVDAVGLSGQVGTYIIDGGSVLEWSSPAGLEELREIKGTYGQDVFLREITMPHPDIVSYPIPRLVHILRTHGRVSSVCAPKDMLVEILTGRRITDVYSWRGLANLDSGRYSSFFLKEVGVSEEMLPPLAAPTDCVGRITGQAAHETGLKAGTAVYAGCNDFFAALIGSGICRPGDLFDMTGTSEHIGGIADAPLSDVPPVSGKYFTGYVRYGVTASSGSSLDYGRRLYEGEVRPGRCLTTKPPLFLPYLNGERCPVCDPMARGVFFGLNTACDQEVMAYSVMEGVVFNLKQILETMNLRHGGRMIVSGGAAQSDVLNQMKADIFDMEIAALDEPDASALGAAMLAGIGHGTFASLNAAAQACVGGLRTFRPQKSYDYAERYDVFRQLYPALQRQFNQWGGA